MKLVGVVLVVLILGGCTTAYGGVEVTEIPEPELTPTHVVRPSTPSPGEGTQSPGDGWPEGFTPAMELLGCAPVPESFLDWRVPDEYRGHFKAAIGGVVTSPTGRWAVIGLNFQDWITENDGGKIWLDYGGARTILTQYPPAGPTSGYDTTLEVINAGRIANKTNSYPGDWISGLEFYTNWSGYLLELGEEANIAARDCVS